MADTVEKVPFRRRSKCFRAVQAVLDAMLGADAVEDMLEGMDIGLAVGELDAVIGEHRMEPVRHRGDEIAQELCCGHLADFLDQPREGELRCPVNRDEQVELAFSGVHFGDIDVKVTDGIAFEFLYGGLAALYIRQAADAMALKTTMQ